MSWIKHDTGFYGHPKVIAAGRDARDVYQAGLCWAGEYFTDGFLPAWCLVRLAADAAGGDGATIDAAAVARRLVAVGLWEVAPGGYQIHDYLKHQTSRARMRTIARKRAQAGAVGGAAPGKQNASKTQANGEANREQTDEQTASIAPAIDPANEPEELRREKEEGRRVNSLPLPPPSTADVVAPDTGRERETDQADSLPAIPKPGQVERAALQQHPLYAPLVELFGRPVDATGWDELRDDVDWFEQEGATREEIAYRAENYPLVMPRDASGRVSTITRRALMKHWRRCAEPPRYADDDDGVIRDEHGFRAAGAVAWAQRYGLTSKGFNRPGRGVG